MSKQRANSRTGNNVQIVVVRTKGARGSKVTFGSVTISGNKPSAGLVKKNVERSTAALERVVKRLQRPGVDIRAKKDVPQFRSPMVSLACSYAGSMARLTAGA